MVKNGTRCYGEFHTLSKRQETPFNAQSKREKRTIYQCVTGKRVETVEYRVKERKSKGKLIRTRKGKERKTERNAIWLIFPFLFLFS